MTPQLWDSLKNVYTVNHFQTIKMEMPCLFHSMFIIVNISYDGFSLSRTRIKQSNLSKKVIRKVVNDADVIVVLKLSSH